MTELPIVFCVSQSAMFSGLNLAVFSLNRLNLEVEVEGGNKAAQRVLPSLLKLCLMEDNDASSGEDFFNISVAQ